MPLASALIGIDDADQENEKSTSAGVRFGFLSNLTL
jgi:hypothetical protein